MSDGTDGLPAGADGVVSYETSDTSPMTVEEAARSLHDARNKAFAQINKPAESAEEATAETELAEEADAGSPQETTGEDQADEPAEPAIEPPKSWTKDLHERWKGLDPETQKTIVERDRQDQAAIKRAFNEAADERKAVKAEREAAEKARQQYEAQLPALMQTLTDAQQSAFADIRTVDDVTKLANEDPFRYLQWQAHQTKLQAVNAEVERAKGQQTQKQQAEWTDHVQKENALAADLIPELADEKKGPALMKRAADRLAELGFKPEELNELASGKSKLSIYDHRFQQLVFSDLKLSDIQKAKTVASAKPLPPVQRPGTSKPAGSSAVAQIQTLEKQLSTASGDKAARISAEIWRLEKKTRPA